MQTAQKNSPDQLLEMPTPTLLVDQHWKQRDEAVWEKFVQPLLTPSSVVLDAGGGPGRLLPRLWGAQKVVLAEPDPIYYLKAKAMAASLSQADQATIDELLATGFDRTISDRLWAIAQDAQPTAKGQVLNVPLFDPSIAQHGPFDLIVCSHVVAMNTVHVKHSHSLPKRPKQQATLIFIRVACLFVTSLLISSQQS